MLTKEPLISFLFQLPESSDYVIWFQFKLQLAASGPRYRGLAYKCRGASNHASFFRVSAGVETSRALVERLLLLRASLSSR